MGELADAIAAALRVTWADLAHTGERFYGFALFTGPAFEYVLASAFSEEGLQQLAGDDESERHILRWSPADSPHHCAGEAHFATVAAREQLVLNVLQGDQSDRSLRDNAARLNPAHIVERFAETLEIREANHEHFTLGASAYQINALACRGGVLAASGSGGELFAFRGKVELRVPRSPGEHWALALGDERLYVSAGKEILVHDVGADALSAPRRFALADDQVRALALLGTTVVASTWGGRISAWREDGTEAWSRTDDAADLAVAADDRIAVAGERGVSLLDAHGELLEKLPRTRSVRALAWSPADGNLAIGSKTTVQIWTRGEKRWSKLKALTAPKAGDVTALAFSPAGTTLAAAYTGGAVRLWNVADGSALARNPCSQSPGSTPITSPAPAAT